MEKQAAFELKTAINNAVAYQHGAMVAQGFWENKDADFLEKIAGEMPEEVGSRLNDICTSLREGNTGEKLMLMVSELGEAMEGHRHGNPPSDHIPEFTAEEEELADVLIRAFDFAGKRKMRLGEAIVAKMEFNATRPRKHGKTC